jgi:hypothetical protein
LRVLARVHSSEFGGILEGILRVYLITCLTVLGMRVLEYIGCSSQFTEYVSPWSDRSTRGITGLRVLTGQLAEATHSMS